MDWIEHALTHNVETIVSEAELRKRLASGKKLRIKFGVDVTNPLIHIGHGVNLWKMREFQDHGHKVIFLIGDFTSRIGDPTGKFKTRPERTKKEIEKDARRYQEQVTKILRRSPGVFEVRRNSEWYDRMPLGEFLGLCKKVTHARLLQRDMFQRRITEGSEIHMHEVLYPILQGYDSVMLKSDLTIVGGDQLFNEMMGRHFQELVGQQPQVIMTTVITPGLDGKEKQSKSLGNFIALSDSPDDMYGKIMTLPDALIIQYYNVYTNQSAEKIMEYEKALGHGANPRDIKMKLAHDIVALYHGENEAFRAEERFKRIFQEKDFSKDAVSAAVSSGMTILNFLRIIHGASSNSGARRLLSGKGVRLNGAPLTDEEFTFGAEHNGALVEVGKRHIYRIVIS